MVKVGNFSRRIKSSNSVGRAAPALYGLRIVGDAHAPIGGQRMIFAFTKGVEWVRAIIRGPGAFKPPGAVGCARRRRFWRGAM